MDNRVSNRLTFAKVGFHPDGGGLYLRVDPSGARRWVQRVTIDGKQRNMGLGPFPEVSLSEARDRVVDNTRLVRQGVDPIAKRQAEREAEVYSARMPTFREAAEALISQNRRTRKPYNAQQWEGSLARHAFPIIGDIPVGDLTTGDVLRVLDPIWTTSHVTAEKVRQRIGRVMDRAILDGWANSNPADKRIREGLPRVRKSKQHHAALPYDEVAGAVDRVQASTADVKLALELLVLTGVRSGEVRGAAWDEIDLADASWTIPAERMGKRGVPFRVPLSNRSVEVLEAARELNGGEGLVFRGRPRGRSKTPQMLSKMVFSELLERVGYWESGENAEGGVLKVATVTPHGFRSSFRDWAGEQTSTPHAVMEAALHHAIPNEAEAAYARSDLFMRRRVLMAEWAAYLPGADTSAAESGL